MKLIPAASKQPSSQPIPAKNVETITQEETKVLHDSHVYVHCYYDNPGLDMLIRIWKSTFLTDTGSEFRSKLIHAENISFAPQWTLIPDKKQFRFLLIFEGLPKSCVRFSLIEDIPQAGGFFVPDIPRNDTDVYHVDIL
jgi:hypothetical protein